MRLNDRSGQSVSRSPALLSIAEVCSIKIAEALSMIIKMLTAKIGVDKDENKLSMMS